MSVINEILPFCPNDTGTNLESQAAYSADSNRTNGNQPGVASSMLNNKAIRQGTYVASQLAQFLANTNNQSVLDNATAAQLLSQIMASLQFLPARITTITATGSGTLNLTYAFFVASANASSGATYSDGTTTFTVSATISAKTILYATGSTAPVLGGSAGTLTKTGGSGDATITYYAARSPLQLEVEMVGGGGGGSAAGSVSVAAGDGADTTFASNTAGGGKGGTGSSSQGGAGGTGSIGSGTGIALAGSYGESTEVSAAQGGGGGSSAFAGGGAGGENTTGHAGAANTGGGGGGGGGTGVSGTGGGSGCYAYFRIDAPTGTYSYSVAVGGTAGTGSSNSGAAGGTGLIILTQHYQ